MGSLDHNNSKARCPLHKELFSFYCVDCEEIICTKCILRAAHLGHALQHLDKATFSIMAKCRKMQDKFLQLKDHLLYNSKQSNKAIDPEIHETGIFDLLRVFDRVDSIVEEVKINELAKLLGYIESQNPAQKMRRTQSLIQQIEEELGSLKRTLKRKDPVHAYAQWKMTEPVLRDANNLASLEEQSSYQNRINEPLLYADSFLTDLILQLNSERARQNLAPRTISIGINLTVIEMNWLEIIHIFIASRIVI